MPHNFHIRRIKDPAGAKRLWKSLVVPSTVYDLWEFRECLYSHDLFELFFYAAFDKDDIVGLLPLQFNSDEGYLEFFGGGYTEDNEIYTRDGFEYAAVDLLSRIDRPAFLYLMRKHDVLDGKFNYAIDDYKYCRDISRYRSVDDFIEDSFRGKSRKNRMRELRILREQYKINVSPANEKDIDLMIDLNIKNLGEESDFASPGSRQLVKDLWNAECGAVAPAVYVDGHPAGATLSFFCNNTYTYFNAGIEKNKYPNLGKFMIFENIKEALSRGATLFDAGPGDLGWKELFGLEKRPLYRISVP